MHHLGRERFDRIAIQDRVKNLGLQIGHDYRRSDLTLCVVLKGAFVFASDLLRHIYACKSINVEFIRARSYVTAVRKSVHVDIPLWTTFTNRDVLIIEDIIDSGYTIQAVQKAVAGLEPESLRVCSLLWKPSKTEKRVKIDYLGFEIPDKWVVGYGLDLDDKYRNLSSIYDLEGQPTPERL